MPKQRDDLTARTFGRWTVLGFSHRDAHGGLWWHCRCACGTERPIYASRLRVGGSRSCGCDNSYHRPWAEDLSGRQFGRLTVLRRSHVYRNGAVVWRCECVCGAQTTVSGGSLRSGQTRSCGCLLSDVAARRVDPWAVSQALDQTLGDGSLPADDPRPLPRFTDAHEATLKRRVGFSTFAIERLRQEEIRELGRRTRTWRKGKVKGETAPPSHWHYLTIPLTVAAQRMGYGVQP